MNYIDILNTIYTKNKLEIVDDLGTLIALTKTLAKDLDNLKTLCDINEYLFYIEPKHFFYLLYFKIKHKKYVPKLIKINKKEELKYRKIYDRIKDVFTLSDRELEMYKNLLDKIIDDKIEKQLKEELGVKNERY